MDLATAPAAIDIPPGFRDPGRDSQAVFRAAMDALSRPGEIRLVPAELSPPRPLEPAMAAIALTLLDFETSFWLPQDAADARNWVRFHTGARIAAGPETADFLFLPRGAAIPPVDALMLGTDEAPHRSTTLVVGVGGFGTGRRFAVSGPGIRDAGDFAVDGLDERIVVARAALHPLFPRGLDMIMTAGDRLAALPRTTRLEG